MQMETACTGYDYAVHSLARSVLRGLLKTDRGWGLQMGDSLRAIQVRSHAQEPSVCFHLMRSDGAVEDFSTNKCIASLFPAWSASHAAKVRIPAGSRLSASAHFREDGSPFRWAIS